MSKTRNTEIAASPPVSTVPTPAAPLTPEQQLAADITANFGSDIMGRIPGLMIFHPDKARFVRARKGFYRPGLVKSSNAAAESSGELQGVPALDAEKGKKRAQYIDSYSLLVDAMTMGLKNLVFTLDTLRWEAALQSLQALQIARSLVRDPNSTLANHLDSMEEEVKRKLKKAKQAPPATPTTPVPTPPQATAPNAAT